MVATELIRVSVLWHEQWHARLQDASRFYYELADSDGMVEVLRPLHVQLKHPSTLREVAFVQMFGEELRLAEALMLRYKDERDQRFVAGAWDYYFIVFKRVELMLPKLTTLDLEDVAPNLYSARNLKVAVPGTPIGSGIVVHIVSIEPKLQVLSSKQRPRKLSICGSDGQVHDFLLKSHEDPRMDEVIMGFFNLVNRLLMKHRLTAGQALQIRRYSITPLSPDTGLIGWVSKCDTLHSLVKVHRKRNGIVLNAEHMHMRGISPETFDSDKKPTDLGYENLMLAQKVDIWRRSIATTKGDDLTSTFWLTSPDANIWLDRRTRYTKSLAVMSIVGYVLGLGDRHPSNIMIHRESGAVLHIDFGDSFEVAQQREIYPEKVPFRLTRVMTDVMEVNGVRGSYRFTCERVMEVLRANRDTLMTVLEAFAHDPVLNWRALNHGSQESHACLPVNEKAQKVLSRVEAKLLGLDLFGSPPASERTTVNQQVQRLIAAATAPENLSRMFIGWCPFF